MVAIVVSNTSVADDTEVGVPVKDDGTPYRFEMLFNGLADRAYADTAEELLACMLPQYLSMTPGERAAARLRHAVRTQTTVQAEINWQYNNLVGNTTPEEQVVLTSSRATPPDVSEWSCEVPLVLVDAFYAPDGSLPRPVSLLADVEDPPNIYWLRVQDEYDYVASLANAGFIDLASHADYLI